MPSGYSSVTFTGGRLVASVTMMLAMTGAMVTFLEDAGFFKPDWAMPILAAAIIGAMAGWTQLGRNLGRDFFQAGLFGVGAAMVALVFFALVYGFRSAWITHASVGFDAAIQVIQHILETGIRVVESALASSRTMAALIVGSLVSGIISEYCDRIWK